MDNFISRALLRRRFLRSTRELLVVSFIGPDGSGKSTLVTAAEAMFTREGEAVGSEYWGRSRGQSRWVQRVRGLGKRLRRRSAGKKGMDTGARGSSHQRDPKASVAGNIGALLYLVDYWYRWFKGPLFSGLRGGILLLDRGPADLKSMYGASPWARNLWRLAPQPDLVVNCVASPEVIYARKGERTPDDLSVDLRGYKEVYTELVARKRLAFNLDTSESISECLDQIRKAVELARLCKMGTVEPALFASLMVEKQSYAPEAEGPRGLSSVP